MIVNNASYKPQGNAGMHAPGLILFYSIINHSYILVLLYIYYYLGFLQKTLDKVGFMANSVDHRKVRFSGVFLWQAMQIAARESRSDLLTRN
jgi:hypothetical protein